MYTSCDEFVSIDLSRKRLIGFDIVASDYKDGLRNIRSICPLLDEPNCHETEIIVDEMSDMEIFISEGSYTQVFGLDTLSLYYFEMDGCSFCGSRIFEVAPSLSWLSIDNCTITIESNDITDVQVTENIEVNVVLDVSTITQLDNPMDEWLKTAPEGMVES